MTIKLDSPFFEELLIQAAQSPRKRSHFNLHPSHDEPVQRLCVALKKGTYVRPHHHPKSNKWELILALRGSVGLVVFDRVGVILEKMTLGPGESMCGIEIQPNNWHSLYPITEDAVILEVKEGPFTPSQPSDFAAWAPEEGDERVSQFLNWLETAQLGDSYKG